MVPIRNLLYIVASRLALEFGDLSGILSESRSASCASLIAAILDERRIVMSIPIVYWRIIIEVGDVLIVFV